MTRHAVEGESRILRSQEPLQRRVVGLGALFVAALLQGGCERGATGSGAARSASEGRAHQPKGRETPAPHVAPDREVAVISAYDKTATWWTRDGVPIASSETSPGGVAVLCDGAGGALVLGNDTATCVESVGAVARRIAIPGLPGLCAPGACTFIDGESMGGGAYCVGLQDNPPSTATGDEWVGLACGVTAPDCSRATGEAITFHPLPDGLSFLPSECALVMGAERVQLRDRGPCSARFDGLSFDHRYAALRLSVASGDYDYSDVLVVDLLEGAVLPVRVSGVGDRDAVTWAEVGNALLAGGALLTVSPPAVKQLGTSACWTKKEGRRSEPMSRQTPH